MRQEIKPFLGYYKDRYKYIESITDQEALLEVPETEGVYVISSNKQRFIYPNGESPIIYIGKSVNLRKRLLEHRTLCNKLFDLKKADLPNEWHYSRYQYIRKFGGRVFYYTRRGTQDGKDLECDIIGRFYSRFHALPVGNGAFSFGT